MRYAAIVWPDLGLQLSMQEAGLGENVVAVLVATEGNVERVRAATKAACAAGVIVGSTVAQARSMVPELMLLRVNDERTRATLEALAEAMGTLSPLVEPCPPQALLLDASAAHLVTQGVAADDEALESRWGGTVLEVGRRLGLKGHLAVAETPQAARLVATYAAMTSGDVLSIVPEGEARKVVGALPVSLLERIVAEDAEGLGGIDELEVGGAAFRWLEELRIRTLAMVRELPRGPLLTRLGAEGERLLSWSEGGRERPLEAHRPASTVEESVAFEPPVAHSQGLLFALRPAIERLALRMGARGEAVTTLSATCELDLFESTGSGPPVRARASWEVRAARPSAEVRVLSELLRGKLDVWQARASVCRITIAVASTSRRREQLALGERPHVTEVLESAIGRLRARLGADSVSVLSVRDTWLPDQATASAPFDPEAAKEARAKEAAEPSIAIGPVDETRAGAWPTRPLRVFEPEEVAYERDMHGRLRGLSFRRRWRRILDLSAPERISCLWHGEAVVRDYRTALLADGTRLWIHLDPQGRCWVQGIHD